MLKRLWRFFALLSVTPIMTVMCLVALGWIIVDSLGFWGVVSRSSILSTIALNVMNDRSVNALQTEREPLEPLGFIASNKMFLIEDGNGFTQVDESQVVDGRAYGIRVTSSDVLVRMGRLAATRVVHHMRIEAIQNREVVTDITERDRLSYKLEQQLRYRHLSLGLQVDYPVRTEHVLIKGYVVNGCAILICFMFLFSLWWIWAGVRWPWGQNRAWQRAAQRPRTVAYCALLLLFSPLTVTAALLCCVFIVSGNLQNARRAEQGTLAAEDIVPARPSGRWQLLHHLDFKEHSVANELRRRSRQIEGLSDHDQLVIKAWNGRFVYSEPERSLWLAAMYEPTGPFVWIDPVPESADDIEALQRVFDTFARQHLRSPRWQSGNPWAGDHFRLLWGGVGRNAALLACIVIGAFSLRWLIDGVVWPWHVRRLRQGACMKCGYSLAGLNADKCPECGTKVELKVTS